ncbi:MAG TPA: DMT family transporter [Candidatus Cloacimonadota bacterium]|nr:DMT family transporter [Candidatus Cloacimonadota bacterium]HQB41208.1 DMT family transporter [Candidatus Cloacimonadota bacterium]
MVLAFFYSVIAIFFFSTVEFAGKLIDSSISPLNITIYRFMIGSLFLLIPSIFQLKRKNIRLKLSDFFAMSIPGILNITISMFLLQLAIFYGKALIVAIIISSNSIFVSIFARMILKEQISKYRIIGMILGIIGMVIVVIGNSGGDLNPAKNMPLGVVYAVLASITFGLFTVLAKKNTHRYGSIAFNCISFFIGAFVLLVFAVIFRQDLTFAPTASNIYGILYLGLFVTGLSYALYSKGLEKIDASMPAMLFLLKPIFASLLAVIFLKETMSLAQIFGVILILFGLSLEHIIKGKKEKN